MDAAPARDSLWEAKFQRLTLVSHFSATTHFGVSLYLHGSLWHLTLPISLSKDRYSPPLNMPVILTAEEILCIGLSYKGFTVDRQRVRRQQNIDRFVSFYGSKPEVCAQIWEDLLDGTIPLCSDEMAPEVVYGQRPEFADFDKDHFRKRLRDLRKRMTTLKV
jgi:hypothetical protein